MGIALIVGNITLRPLGEGWAEGAVVGSPVGAIDNSRLGDKEGTIEIVGLKVWPSGVG